VLPRVLGPWGAAVSAVVNLSSRGAAHEEGGGAIEDVEVDEPIVEHGISPAVVLKRANGRPVTSATTAQKQNKRRGKCMGDVPVVPITRYFVASPAAVAATQGP
jgi:hypothetical protein